MSPQELTQAARGWVGVPYRHQGRSRSGIDCGGLLVMIAQPAGLIPGFEDRTDYNRAPTRRLRDLLEQFAQPAPAPREGCILFLRWKLNQQPSHLAYFTGQTLIHAYGDAGRVVETSYREPWVRRTVSCWQFRGLRYE